MKIKLHNAVFMSSLVEVEFLGAGGELAEVNVPEQYNFTQGVALVEKTGEQLDKDTFNVAILFATQALLQDALGRVTKALNAHGQEVPVPQSAPDGGAKA